MTYCSFLWLLCSIVGIGAFPAAGDQHRDRRKGFKLISFFLSPVVRPSLEWTDLCPPHKLASLQLHSDAITEGRYHLFGSSHVQKITTPLTTCPEEKHPCWRSPFLNVFEFNRFHAYFTLWHQICFSVLEKYKTSIKPNHEQSWDGKPRVLLG